MGATRVPVITNPGPDPGREQTPKRTTDSTDVRGGGYRDPESMTRSPGGAATTRCSMGLPTSTHNGPEPRDRSNRS